MHLTTVKCLGGLLLALFAGLLPACASVSPWGTAGQFDLAEDEKRIWNRSIEEAKRLDESGQLYGAPETVEYVNGVALKLVPQTLRASEPFDIRVRIIKNPLLNAFALSHGAIYIHTGMLAKLENEAQLATILAHELTHITHRHPVQHFRTIQNVTTALALLQIAALPAGAKEGKNSWGKSAYGGPAPPPGKPHRYFFKLYALSAPLGLAAGASKTDLEHAMKGKTLAVAQWMGTYGR